MSRNKSILKYKTKNRMYFIIFLFLVIYGILIYRLVQIQYINSNFYKDKVKSQSSSTINLNSGRGTIFDRNNKKITDTKSEDIIVIQKEKIN